MDEIALTKLFVEYSEAVQAVKLLRAEIEAAILERGETAKIAGVTASYYKPTFETPDYESAAKADMPGDFDLNPFSVVTTTIRWKEVCERLGVVAPKGAPKPAHVVIKP